MRQSDVFGRTIQLFLVDGTPNELIIASIHGWTGSVLVTNQASFAKMLTRPEVDRTGIYIFFGPDPEDALSMRAYIGEADSVKDRVVQSAGERAFWETALVVTTSDEALTKGHVRYLEARLIELALKAGRVKLDNGQVPKAEKRFLPEADRANMESFLSNLGVILPVVGLDLLKPRPPSVTSKVTSLPAAGQFRFEIRHKTGIHATATQENGEFIVFEGSEAQKNAGYKGVFSYGELKNELVNGNVLQPSKDGSRFVFAKSYPFKSPSAAAAVVLDRSANGRTEWKVVGGDQTYHQWQSQQ